MQYSLGISKLGVLGSKWGQKGLYGMYNISVYLVTWTRSSTFLQVKNLGLKLFFITCRCVLRSLKFRNFGFALGSNYKRSKRTICHIHVWCVCVAYDFSMLILISFCFTCDIVLKSRQTGHTFSCPHRNHQYFIL